MDAIHSSLLVHNVKWSNASMREDQNELLDLSMKVVALDLEHEGRGVGDVPSIAASLVAHDRLLDIA
jgi:hypothetical protein